MKTIVLFFLICAGVFYGAQYYTTTWAPERNRKKLCEAAKKYYAVNKVMPGKFYDLKNFVDDIDDFKQPYKGSWIMTPEDKENPVKIYRWKYYRCSKDGEEIEVTNSEFPCEVQCSKCGSKYSVEESELYSKEAESLVEGNKRK